MSAAPRGSRVLAALGALAVTALVLVERPLALAAAGCPATGAALALAATPLVAFLTLLAASPATLQRLLARHTALDLRQAAHVTAAVVMAGAIFFLLGWGATVGAAATLEARSGGCPLEPQASPTSDQLVAGVLQSFAVFSLTTILYVSLVHGQGPAGTLRALGLRKEGAARAAGLGLALAVAFIVALTLAVAALAPLLPEEALQNEQALAIARALTLPAAIVLALGSGIGEELFFRGFLQPRFGLLPISIVFALAHVSYGSVSEVVVVFLLSLALGLSYKWTGHIVTPMAAHAAFNFIELMLGMYAPELAG